MSERFDIRPLPLDGLHLVERVPRADARGYLERMFCGDELRSVIGQRTISQVNHTLTKHSGTVRGMHYQHQPHAEMKIVSCLRGEIYDVAIDLRKSSPTFMRWHGETLSAENHRSLVVPEGFAHGFQSLSDDCEVLYFTTAMYEPTVEAAVNALDPRLGIEWPLPIRDRSPRDEAHPMIGPEFSGVSL